ncbi:MAG: exodeoxyribonuclease V subunit beta [Deltaproteobacteria bacterium]
MSQDSRRLDLFAVPLGGTQAIEASAGTGKTWTITGLYVRLLLETDFEVPDILVVTYTKAATAELRTRIRQRLGAVGRALAGIEGGDDFCKDIVARVGEDGGRARLRCERALHQLDEASVFTIHGFCQRALEDAAFESGSAFASEMLQDQEEWIRTCVEDFWRQQVQGRDPDFLQYLLVKKKYTPAKLQGEVEKWIGRPYFRRLPPAPVEDVQAAELNGLRADLLDWLDAELPRRKAERRQLYFDDLLLNLRNALASEQRGARLAARIRRRFRAALIDEFQDTDPIQYEIFSGIYGGQDNPVFLVGDPKQAIYGFRGADIFAYLKARESAAARHSLEENWRTVPRLIAGVNALFERAEDPFVFSQIEFHPAAPAERDRPKVTLGGLEKSPLRVWFIEREDGVGKPQKAKAVRDRILRKLADEIAGLLEAGRKGEACIGDESVSGRNIAVLVANGSEAEAVRGALARRGVASVRRGRENVFASREAEELERVLLAIADPARERRIRAALATGLHGLDAAAIYAIAQTESEWDAVQQHFRELRDQHFAEGVSAMLAHWLSANKVVARLLSAAGGERALTNLLHLLELLRAEGMRQRQGIDRLVAWFAEHRRLAKLAGGTTGADELVVRLESDENLVQIVTIHSCKGLEYDFVFCPFTHAARKLGSGNPMVDFHDEKDDWRPTLDLGSEAQDEHRQTQAREELANRLRLLYVALTRAKHACVFTWGSIENAENSALGWLLLPRDANGDADKAALAGSDESLRVVLEELRLASGGALAIESIADDLNAGVNVAAPGAGEVTQFVARQLSRRIRTTRWTTSFSALTAGRGAERRDHDSGAAPAMAAAMPPGRSIFSFPKGAVPGVCLHRIFEKIDFQNQDPDARRAHIIAALAAFRFDPEWLPVVEQMVDDVLHTSLEVDGSVLLADVARTRRLDEVEFHYPAATITLDDLNALLARHGLAGLGSSARDEELPTPLTQGYVKGYIDLVFESGGRFYLVDYKSNWLGPQLEDYAAPRLPSVMQEQLYTLQYLTYTVAVHRMLQRRLSDYDYDRHFGGVRYLFLRGMRPLLGSASGVFAHRPPRALVEEFDERLRG